MEAAPEVTVVAGPRLSLWMLRFFSNDWHDRWFACNLTGLKVWIGLNRFPPIVTKRLGDCDILVGSHLDGRLARIRCGVGRGNKFVLLDMTEEPEAKKLTVYNTNEI